MNNLTDETHTGYTTTPARPGILTDCKIVTSLGTKYDIHIDITNDVIVYVTM